MADFVAAHELTVLPHTVTLGYEMLTADQVLKRLLPEGMDVPSSFEQRLGQSKNRKHLLRLLLFLFLASWSVVMDGSVVAVARQR